MSEQANDETKSGQTAVTPSGSEAVGKSEKGADDLPEDELSKISGGLTKPYSDSY